MQSPLILILQMMYRGFATAHRGALDRNHPCKMPLCVQKTTTQLSARVSPYHTFKGITYLSHKQCLFSQINSVYSNDVPFNQPVKCLGINLQVANTNFENTPLLLLQCLFGGGGGGGGGGAVCANVRVHNVPVNLLSLCLSLPLHLVYVHFFSTRDCSKKLLWKRNVLQLR